MSRTKAHPTAAIRDHDQTPPIGLAARPCYSTDVRMPVPVLARGARMWSPDSGGFMPTTGSRAGHGCARRCSPVHLQPRLFFGDSGLWPLGVIPIRPRHCLSVCLLPWVTPRSETGRCTCRACRPADGTLGGLCDDLSTRSAPAPRWWGASWMHPTTGTCRCARSRVVSRSGVGFLRRRTFRRRDGGPRPRWSRRRRPGGGRVRRMRRGWVR